MQVAPRAVTWLCALLGAPLVASAGQDCLVADAVATRFWVEEAGFRQYAAVHVRIAAEPGAGRTAYVDGEAVFHYRRRDGWSNKEFARFGGGIDLRRQAFGDFVADTRASNCRREAPCMIEHVELRDLRCRQ